MNGVSGRQGKFALLGYLETSCNCLWVILCPLGAILEIKFGRFPAVSRFPLLQSGVGRNSAEFSRSSKM